MGKWAPSSGSLPQRHGDTLRLGMDFFPAYLDAKIDADAWRMVAEALAAKHGISPAELDVLRRDALDTLNSIPELAQMRSSQSASPGGIAAVLSLLSAATLKTP